MASVFGEKSLRKAGSKNPVHSLVQLLESRCKGPTNRDKLRLMKEILAFAIFLCKKRMVQRKQKRMNCISYNLQRIVEGED